MVPAKGFYFFFFKRSWTRAPQHYRAMANDDDSENEGGLQMDMHVDSDDDFVPPKTAQSTGR